MSPPTTNQEGLAPMKEVTVTCEWRSTHVVEVPDDFEIPAHLDGFPNDVLEELTATNAELVDWS